MTATDFNLLWKSIDILEAQEHLMNIDLTTFSNPRIKQSFKNEKVKKVQAKAYPRDLYKRETKDVNFLLEKLGGGNGRRK